MNTSHYPSLTLCKKLTEIGFPETERNKTQIDSSKLGHRYVCPSVMEMLEVIYQYLEDNTLFLVINKDKVVIEDSDGDTIKIFISTLPNALAEMILWLHKKKHISFTK